MQEQPRNATTATRPLRILEVGSGALFTRAVPDQTDYFFAGARPRGRTATPLGPLHFIRALRQLRRGEYDLVVLHAASVPPWHPRMFLPLLRDKRLFAWPWLCAPFGWRLLQHFHDVPIVAIDLRDTFGISRANVRLLDVCRAFYKRELPADRWQAFFKSGHWDLPGRRWRRKRRNQRRLAKLRPISYASGDPPLPQRPDVRKTTDLFFAGDAFLGTTPRADGIPELRALKAEGYRIDLPESSLPHDEFLARLATAWLAWSPAGYGWQCARDFEAAGVGTVMLANYPTIMRDMPLRDGEHCLFYSPEPGELAAAVRKALADKPRLQRIADAAYEHAHRHHTHRARAERITVAVVGRKLDGTPVEGDSEAVESPARA